MCSGATTRDFHGTKSHVRGNFNLLTLVFTVGISFIMSPFNIMFFQLYRTDNYRTKLNNIYPLVAYVYTPKKCFSSLSTCIIINKQLSRMTFKIQLSCASILEL